jgi:2-methylisocitrate lyase-like PEP mutase family enzyme
VKPTEVLRRRIAEGGLLAAPGAFDPLSAMLVEQAGYEAVYLTGGGFSRANGLPDLGLLTMSEVVAFVERVCDVVSIPVVADLDNGYGSALNVRRAVRAFEKAGIAGFHLEDQVLPKKCGHYEGKEVVSTAEMVGKIKAAVDARRDDDLVVIARTDARAVEGLDAALERVGAYIEAGADLGFVEAPQSLDELEEIPKRQPRATMVNIFEGGKTPFVAAAQLESWGYRIAIYPSQTQRSAIWAMRRTLEAMKGDGSSSAVADQMMSFREREEVVGTAAWNKLSERYSEGG